MDRPSDDIRDRQQEDAMAAGEGKRVSNDGTNEGAGTPEGGADTGVSGVTRTSAPPGETGGYGSELEPGGLTGGYGTGGLTPEEQADENGKTPS